VSAEVIWLSGLIVGMAIGVCIGLLLATAGIPSLVDAVFALFGHDRSA
jgi:hypothetical protein